MLIPTTGLATSSYFRQVLALTQQGGGSGASPINRGGRGGGLPHLLQLNDGASDQLAHVEELR